MRPEVSSVESPGHDIYNRRALPRASSRVAEVGCCFGVNARPCGTVMSRRSLSPSLLVVGFRSLLLRSLDTTTKLGASRIPLLNNRSLYPIHLQSQNSGAKL